jgi:hypothetical protein
MVYIYNSVQHNGDFSPESIGIRQAPSNVSVVTEHIYTKLNCCFEMNPSTVQQTFLLTLGFTLVSDR